VIQPSLDLAPTPAAAAYSFHCAIGDKDFARAVARVTEALTTTWRSRGTPNKPADKEQ